MWNSDTYHRGIWNIIEQAVVCVTKAVLQKTSIIQG